MENLKGIAVCTAALVAPAAMFMTLNGPAEALISQYLGAAALIAMALSQIMATRAWFVEPIFGPLDKAYVLHKWLGIGALLAVLLHDSIGAEIKSLGRGGPMTDFAEDLGEQSLNALLILLAITLMTFIPYRIWYWTHRAMGACFVLGAVHFALILKPFSVIDPLGLYVLIFCILGTLSYAYALVPRAWRRGYMYTVKSIDKTGGASALTLHSEGRPMRHRAGQFAFFTIEHAGLSETHPFTISSAPREDGSLQVSVASLGDYTRKLGQHVQVGMKVRVQGPYGRFTLPRRNKSQVWIAGGIGITPFLAWLQNLEPVGPPVDLFYTYRGASNAPHLNEIERLSNSHGRVRLHLFDTTTGPRLTSEAVLNATNGNGVKYAFCGPADLRNALIQEIGSRNIQYEVFEIRTGLPISKRLIKNFAARIRGYVEVLILGNNTQ